MSESAKYIMALLDVPGVGRVAASRLTDHFHDAAELLSCPREQLLLRLKGVARSSEIAEELSKTLRDRMRAAGRVLDDLATHEIEALTPLDSSWPAGLDDLDRSERPVILFVHGDLSVLERRLAAVFARPPLTQDGFEKSQTALRRILRAQAVPMTGGSTDFDAVVHRVCSSPDHAAPSVLVLPCGLGKMSAALRPIAAAVVKTGGLLISSFDLEHGPFEHDDVERAMIQASLSDASIFIEPGDSAPERRALKWVITTRKPVFVIGGSDPPPDAHRIVDDVDFDWLELALTLPEDEIR